MGLLDVYFDFGTYDTGDAQFFFSQNSISNAGFTPCPKIPVIDILISFVSDGSKFAQFMLMCGFTAVSIDN